MSDDDRPRTPLAPPERIRARVDATDWREAVRAAGDLLVAGDCCTPDYVDAMEAAVVDLGPYIVIAPGVAMPHARPESGVTAPGVAIVTLAQPVEFGHRANDPVSSVIAFAAVDKDSHVDVMRRIVELVTDEAAMTALQSSGTDIEAAEAISASSQ